MTCILHQEIRSLHGRQWFRNRKKSFFYFRLRAENLYLKKTTGYNSCKFISYIYICCLRVFELNVIILWFFEEKVVYAAGWPIGASVSPRLQYLCRFIRRRLRPGATLVRCGTVTVWTHPTYCNNKHHYKAGCSVQCLKLQSKHYRHVLYMSYSKWTDFVECIKNLLWCTTILCFLVVLSNWLIDLFLLFPFNFL